MTAPLRANSAGPAHYPVRVAHSHSHSLAGPSPLGPLAARIVVGLLVAIGVAVLVGAEGPGLTETAMRASDVRVRIPMSRGTDSLNVATAAALAFYERARG